MDNSIYKYLDISPMINAAGTYTKVGGSRMSEKTLKDMAEAARSHVDIKELQIVVNKRLAKLTNNEAACVCNGAASGLYIATACCIALKTGRSFNELSFEEICSHEIIMFAAHRNPYDWSIRQLGVTIKEVGYPNTLHISKAEDLNSAINEKTAGIFFIFSNKGGWIAEGGLDLETTIEIAKNRNISVVVDAAAQLPPVENLWSFTKQGATAALFSGGKDLRGPQSSGLIVGKEQFLSKFEEINFFNYGIGRMLKTGREEIVGLFSAVEQYITMDHNKRNQWVENQIAKLVEFSKQSSFFDIIRTFPNEAGQPMARAEVKLKKADIPLDRISQALRSGAPSIFTLVDQGHLYINPMTLFDDEIEIIISRLKSIENDL